MIVKNITADNIPINKSVQIDVNTPDSNDGYVLPNQILDLSKSLTPFDLLESQEVKKNIYEGNLIFVVNGIELESADCIEIYESGVSSWATIFNEKLSEANLHAGLASGFIYAKNCLIG